MGTLYLFTAIAMLIFPSAGYGNKSVDPTIGREESAFSPFSSDGLWVNESTDTRGIACIDISVISERIRIETQKMCHPSDYYWGTNLAAISDTQETCLSLTWNRISGERDQRISYLAYRQLRVDTRNHYINDSGKSDRDNTDFFSRRVSCDTLHKIPAAR